MILISHRGNINGINKGLENHPMLIFEALNKDYHVEIDVWFKKNKFYLGHDEPEFQVESSFFKNDKLWCHAKNIEALYQMVNRNIHCFYHQTDDVTLTSKGYLWTSPNKTLTKKSVMVLPEIQNLEIPTKIHGLCSDVIENYEEYR